MAEYPVRGTSPWYQPLRDYIDGQDQATLAAAVHPADLAAVATTGAYGDLTGTPNLGTAAATDSSAYATAAQGTLATTAAQVAGDLGGTPTAPTVTGGTHHTHTASQITDLSSAVGAGNGLTKTGAGTAASPVTLAIGPALPLVATTPSAVLSANLAPTDLSTWTLAGGATATAGVVTLGTTGTISTTITATSGQIVQVDLTRGSDNGSPIVVSLGSVSDAPVGSWSSSSHTVVAGASGPQTLTVTSVGFTGTISAIVVRTVTNPRSKVATNPSIWPEVNGNQAIGASAQRSLTTGSNNQAIGDSAQRSLTTGSSNQAIGYSAASSPLGNSGWASTTASRQVCIGDQSGQGSATQVDEIVAIGWQATVQQASSVAIGARANSDHASSVALGNDTSTHGDAQVCIGPRDLEIDDAARGPILRDSSGGRWRVTVSTTGTLTTTKL